MADLVEKYLENNRIQLILRNFFQLNVEVLDAELVSSLNLPSCIIGP